MHQLVVALISYWSLCFALKPFSKRDGHMPDESKPNSFQPDVKKPLMKIDCKISDLKITECDIEVSRLGNQRISALYNRTCNLREAQFNFHFGFEKKYSFTLTQKKPEIAINDIKKKLDTNKVYLRTGKHYIYVEMKAKSMKNVDMNLRSQNCTFFVEHEKPTPSLGRINRNVNEGDTFYVNATKSLNNDFGEMNVDLTYRWNCSDTVGFCDGRNFGKSGIIVVGKKYATKGAKFTFILEAKTPYSEWQRAFQFIRVNSSLPYSINCIANCGKEPNKLNALKKPRLFAECNFHCESYNNRKINGLITSAIGDKKTSYKLSKFAVRPKLVYLITANSNLRVIAYYEKNQSYILGEQNFSTYPIPRLENCKSIPASGTPLTKFKISCSYDKDQVQMFSIEVKSRGTVVFSTSAKELDDIEFVIPSNSTAKVRIEDINDVHISQKVAVQILPIVANATNITDVVKILNDILDGKNNASEGIDKLIAQKDFKKAVQLIDVVARELPQVASSPESDELVSKMKKKLLDYLTRLTVDDFGMVKSVSGVIKLIAENKISNKSDSNTAMKLGKMCNEVAKKQLNLLENDIEGNIDETDVKDVTQNLLSCGESEIAPYFEIFQNYSATIEITTEFPVRSDLSENNIEEYPEYFADDLIDQSVNDFITAAEYIVEICRNSGKSLILVSSLYNDLPTYVEQSDTVVGVLKGTGMKIAGNRFFLNMVQVTVSSFMEHNTSLLAVQVCLYKHDPFWSSSKTFKISTNVVDVSMRDLATETEIKQFGTKPMEISFVVIEDYVAKKIHMSIDFSKPIITEHHEDNFIILIFKTKAMEGFFVQFYDLGELDVISVVLLDMERPRLHHFSIANNITKSNDRLYMKNQVDEDKWFLLGVRRDKDAILKRSSFKISVYTIKCLQWDYDTSSWKRACEINETTTSKEIKCECLHLSTIAGSLEYNDIKEHPKFVAITFFLQERTSIHICITVCIVLGIYFTLIVYSIQKHESEEDAVYFLSDIPADNRYGYLISIYTSGKLDAGTTSDVMIQIFGTEGKSQEHVLNFPDPFLELLQRRQNDMFVLATYKDLGTLLKIHLWIDCAGISPNWYCEEVRIFDLQRKRWYVFNVNKWLRIDGTPRLFLDVPVQKTNINLATRPTIKTRFLRFSWRPGGFEHSLFRMGTRSQDPRFQFSKRITLILSILLTLMMFLLCFHGIPEMTVRDSITPECYYTFDRNIVNVGLFAATITFFPHIAVMFVFKKSRILNESQDENQWPHFFTIAAWLFLIINIVTQVHLLLIFGYWLIPPTTWQWTTSLLIALLFYIFVLDYSFNMVMRSIRLAKKEVQLNLKKILKNVEYQRRYLYSRFGRSICRPIFTPLYQVMGSTDYLKKLVFFRQKREVLWHIQDLIMIFSFIIFLYVIVLQEKNTTYDVLGHSETLLLLEGRENLKKRWLRVTQVDEFEEFMESIFIPTLQAYKWYGKYVSETPGLTSDSCNRYLGIIRLRQLRAELIHCDIPKLMLFINRSCTATKYVTHFDYLNYTPAWSDTIPEYHRSRLGYVWGYQDATGESKFGISGYYHKGGYIALLGRTMKNSLVNLEYLKRYGWMDILTRAVFIEFPFYNVNTNLFHFASVMFEKTPTGYIHKRAAVNPVRVLKEGSNSTTLSLLFIIVFMVLIVIITVRTVLRIMRTKLWYKRDLWHFADFVIVVMSIAWIVMYFQKLIDLKNFVQELEKQRSNTFVDYFHLEVVESWNKLLTSALITFITIRIWKLLLFAKVFCIVERTLAYSFQSLMCCFLYFLIACTAFGMLGIAIFCTDSDQFKNTFSTIKTLIQMTIGLRGPNTLHLDGMKTSLGYAFIVLYNVVSYFFTTVFIAIIVVNFLKAKEFSFEERTEYNIKEYTKDQIGNFKRYSRMWVRKFRLRAGKNKKEDEEPVTPKSNDIRYMNYVSINSVRMRAMQSVAKCVILKKKKGLMIDESDHAEMMKTLRYLFGTEIGENEVYFKQTTEPGCCTFIEDRRLLMMEEVVNRMLETSEKRATRLKIMNEIELLLAENKAKLEMMNYRLKTMLNVLDKISIQVTSRRK